MNELGFVLTVSSIHAAKTLEKNLIYLAKQPRKWPVYNAM